MSRSDYPTDPDAWDDEIDVVRCVARSLAENFCGCCGAAIGAEHEWCSRCLDHVLGTGQMHTRTFYAQFKRECPFQICDCPKPSPEDVSVTQDIGASLTNAMAAISEAIAVLDQYMPSRDGCGHDAALWLHQIRKLRMAIGICSNVLHLTARDKAFITLTLPAGGTDQ